MTCFLPRLQGLRTCSSFISAFALTTALGLSTAQAQDNDATRVSFADQVRPILQVKCFGCHQANRAEGGLDLTAIESWLAHGDEDSVHAEVVVPGDPGASRLWDVVRTDEGAPEMPPDGEPLTDAEQQSLRMWIEQGAGNDWVAEVVLPTADNPPVYRSLPAVVALDASSDGRFLAVGGIHEVWLVDVSSKSISNRLMGLSPRIESVAFSPDGQRLAVAGGKTGEFGELQVWDVDTGTILWTRTVTADVVRGVSWSSDSDKVAIACNDTSVRGFSAVNGQPILLQNASEDWIHDTAFSVDGQYLVSVGRDRTCKLTEVATERFVDNITSITPGVLKGGLTSIARHPERDELLMGGADGTPRLYRMHRLTARVIGDDANLIRQFPAQPGVIHAVSIAADGKRLAAASTLNGRGYVRIYGYEFDTSLPEEIKGLVAKVAGSRSAEENARLQQYLTADIVAEGEIDLPSGVFSVCFGDSKDVLWVGGADGQLRRFQRAGDQWGGEIVPLIEPTGLVDAGNVERQWSLATKLATAPADGVGVSEETLPNGKSALPAEVIDGIRNLKVIPSEVSLNSAADYSQLIIMAELEDGTWRDVTRWATFSTPTGTLEDAGLEVSSDGLLQVLSGDTKHAVSNAVSSVGPSESETVSTESEALTPIDFTEKPESLLVKVGAKTLELPMSMNVAQPAVEFVRDVQPVLTRLGCNAGSCHGAADGKNGFKLSLRGYDPEFDVRSLTDELWGRRVNPAEPAASLMLQKATARVPHEGGHLIKPGSKAYWILHQWIENGAVLESEPVRTVGIELEPALPVLGDAGQPQQMRVVATLSDGTKRDVTREAFVEIGDIEIAAVSSEGVVNGLRRGETPILARYDGCYAATTMTVMGDRSGFEWSEPPTFNQVDSLVSQKWQRMKIQPAPLCDDYEFVRRVYLDLTGLPPTVEQIQSFVADNRATQAKRDALIDQLVSTPEFVDYWTNKWSDLLQVNRKFLAKEGAEAFHGWIRQQIEQNTPYDQFVYELITATGSNRENPAASYFKILRQPDLIMENTTHLFLAIRFNCNKCHDHPFERWTQDQYFQTAAFFSQIGLEEDPASGGKRIGGTAVEGAQPLYEIVKDRDSGDMIHDRTRTVAAPMFPYALAEQYEQTSLKPQPASTAPVVKDASRREQFADWLVSPNNPYFAKSYVNRMWGYLLGTGLIEPLDDIRASNPPSNPELLAHLEESFIASGFNTRQLIAMICKSRTYQLSVATNPFNEDDTLNYSHAKARRLPAEVLFDAMHHVTGSRIQIPGVPAGTRASQLPDVGVNLPSGFLATLGRPVRESACECERSADMQLGAVLAMVSGPDVARVLSNSENTMAGLAAETSLSERELIEAIYLRVLNRPASSEEVNAILEQVAEIRLDRDRLHQSVTERRDWWGQERTRLELERQARIDAAQHDLEQYITTHDAQLPEREAARLQAIQDAEAALAQYQSSEAIQYARWRTEQLGVHAWHVGIPFQAEQSNESQLTVLADRSVRATLGTGAVETTLYFQTQLPSISRLRLEALADSELAGGGPGLAQNGNFVVNEWTIEYSFAEAPETWHPVKVAASREDFAQANFASSELFNGVTNDNGDGWAVHPETKKTHWVVAQFSEAVSSESPVTWRMRLIQNYSDGKHALGRFRLSFAAPVLTNSNTTPSPLALSLPEELLAELANHPGGGEQPLADSVPEQLLQWFRAEDPMGLHLREQLASAQKPVHVDPGVVERRETLSRAMLPVPDDRQLLRLERDLKAAEDQLAQERLTLTQDLTWALFNSPSFMFNR